MPAHTYVFESVISEHMPKIATARNKATTSNWNKGGMLGQKKISCWAMVQSIAMSRFALGRVSLLVCHTLSWWSMSWSCAKRCCHWKEITAECVFTIQCDITWLNCIFSGLTWCSPNGSTCSILSIFGVYSLLSTVAGVPLSFALRLAQHLGVFRALWHWQVVTDKWHVVGGTEVTNLGLPRVR